MSSETPEPSPSPKPVTMQVIAEKAGVTKSLVSMAMRNSPRVALKTRERIQALARELGYRPNPMVRALMSRVRSGGEHADSYRATLAFVTNFPTADRWRELHTYPEYFNGARERGREIGYQVEHFWLGKYKANPSRFIDILKARGISGLLIAPFPQSGSNRTFDMSLEGFCPVTIGYSLADPHVHRVCNHHVQTVLMGVEQLAKRGYKRIGFAIGERDIKQVNHLWMAGYYVSCGRFPDLDFVIMDPKDWTGEAFVRWYKQEKPEVIVAVNQESWTWIQHLGVSIPDELGFLHLDCRQDDVLSGMYQKTRILGSAAVDMLASLVESNTLYTEQEPRVLMLQSDFHEGTTLRPAVGPAADRVACGTQ